MIFSIIIMNSFLCSFFIYFFIFLFANRYLCISAFKGISQTHIWTGRQDKCASAWPWRWTWSGGNAGKAHMHTIKFSGIYIIYRAIGYRVLCWHSHSYILNNQHTNTHTFIHLYMHVCSVGKYWVLWKNARFLWTEIFK